MGGGSIRKRCKVEPDPQPRWTKGYARLAAPAPLEATLPDPAERKPSEIPSRTQSVPAFHLGRVSVGAQLLRRSPLEPGTPLRENAEGGRWTRAVKGRFATFFRGGKVREKAPRSLFPHSERKSTGFWAGTSTAPATFTRGNVSHYKKLILQTSYCVLKIRRIACDRSECPRLAG